MRIIDTHSHIYDVSFNDDILDVISRAKEIGVEKILLPNIDVDSVDSLHRLVDSSSSYCLPMMGLHPTSVDANFKESLSILRRYLESSSYNYVGIGEIGIDLYWDNTFIKEQKEAFEQQLEWSIEYNLPVAIHTREATNEAVESIKNVGVNKLKGVFHSFVGTHEELHKILELENFCIGINGVVTYKNSNLKEVLLETDLSKIIVETDAPYLTPVPYRGKRNEPSYTQHIVSKLSEIYQIEIEQVGEITTRNAIELFGLEF